MPRKSKAIEEHRSTQRQAPEDQVLKCPHCTRWFSKVGSYRKHIRSHPEQVQAPPPSPPTKLLSRRSVDSTVGVYDFATILEEAEDDISFRQEADSDADSFYSDGGHDSPRKSDRDRKNSESNSEDINSSDGSYDDDLDNNDDDVDDGNSQGYNIPKMHALAKMIDYIVLFGSAMNFYGGPGEASHKSFVKAPGLKTQRRVCEFASQVADQYYIMMVARKACKYVDIRMVNERIRDNTRQYVSEEEGEYSAEGAYTVDIYPNGTVNLLCKRNKHMKKYGLDDTFIRVVQRFGNSDNGDDDSSDGVSNNATHRYHGYTKAKVVGNGGQVATYNAHPHYHGGPW